MSLPRRALLPALAAALLVAVPLASRADELALVGERLALTGTRGGAPVTGWVEIAPDATYTGERRVDGGEAEALGGRAEIDGRDLVLHPARGLAGVVEGQAPPAPRRYVRADAGRHVRWRLAAEGEVETLSERDRTENRLELVGRVLKRQGGVWNWLLRDNRGVVEATPGLELYRSKEPSPNDVVRWQERDGVKTILSLNGDLDEEKTYYPPRDPGDDAPPRGERVNLGRFIEARGLDHPFVRMGASRAPSEAELLAVFRVLVDDARRPLLLHCQGGSDRTGVISAIYQMEFQGVSRAEAKRTMRRHLWVANGGTEIQGAFLDLYQVGTVTRLLERAGVAIPERLRRGAAPAAPEPR